MFQVIVVAPAGFLLDVLETFALVLHKFPLLLIDESLSPRGFDEHPYLDRGAGLLIPSSGLWLSVHVVRRMSSAWVQGTTTLPVFNHLLSGMTTSSF
jgi:hypothetical protein